MARFDGDFRLAAEEPVSLDELLSLLGGKTAGEERSREHAIACYLSGSDGWREAVKLLGGTFAEGPAGLRERKED